MLSKLSNATLRFGARSYSRSALASPSVLSGSSRAVPIYLSEVGNSTSGSPRSSQGAFAAALAAFVALGLGTVPIASCDEVAGSASVATPTKVQSTAEPGQGKKEGGGGTASNSAGEGATANAPAVHQQTTRGGGGGGRGGSNGGGFTSKYKLARRNSMRRRKKHYPYVVVGAGTTAHAAIEAIRLNEPNADILVISDEVSLPRIDAETGAPEEFFSSSVQEAYNEWRRHVSARLDNEPDAYSSSPITLLLGRSDMHIDVEKKAILLKDGTTIGYGKCLIASAGKPRDFYVLDSNKISYSLKDRINTCSSRNDFLELDSLAAAGQYDHATVVGGGFLGTEIACALALAAKSHGSEANETGEGGSAQQAEGQGEGEGELEGAGRDDVSAHAPGMGTGKARGVSQVFVEAGVLQRFLPKYLSHYLTKAVRDFGVDVITERLVTGVKRSGSDNGGIGGGDALGMAVPSYSGGGGGDMEEDALTVSLLGWEKEQLDTDYVVLASTHITPSTRVARTSALEVDGDNGGIVVNSSLEAFRDLYVAGNLASYYDPSMGRRRRVDAYDHAVNSGIHAGNNMSSPSGFQTRYTHQPMFRSHLQGVGPGGSGIIMEGFGIIDSSLTTVGVWLANRDEASGEVKERTPDSDFTRGVVYYVEGGKVVGILLWNASDHVEKAREVLRQQRAVGNPEELKSKILLAPETWLDVVVAKV